MDWPFYLMTANWFVVWVAWIFLYQSNKRWKENYKIAEALNVAQQQRIKDLERVVAELYQPGD